MSEADSPIPSVWSIVLKANKKELVKFPDTTILTLTNACIPEIPKGLTDPVRVRAHVNTIIMNEYDIDDETEPNVVVSEPIIISLIPGVIEHQFMNVLFSPYNYVTLENLGAADVHIAGNLEEIDTEEEEDNGEEEEDVAEEDKDEVDSDEEEDQPNNVLAKLAQLSKVPPKVQNQTHNAPQKPNQQSHKAPPPKAQPKQEHKPQQHNQKQQQNQQQKKQQSPQQNNKFKNNQKQGGHGNKPNQKQNHGKNRR